uniref:Conotoxin Superfamily SF12 n=1 Tax=Conus episcopatus TaxID=88764 RepID=A0A0K2S716_CONEP|nr:Conotoxin Superfamily SF12 [Conus episcopatus]
MLPRGLLLFVVSLTFLQFFLPVFFFLSPSHLLSLLLPAPC